VHKSIFVAGTSSEILKTVHKSKFVAETAALAAKSPSVPYGLSWLGARAKWTVPAVFREHKMNRPLLSYKTQEPSPFVLQDAGTVPAVFFIARDMRLRASFIGLKKLLKKMQKGYW